jgi:hypothetical protein
VAGDGTGLAGLVEGADPESMAAFGEIAEPLR